MLSDNKQFGCVLDYGHEGKCCVGARGVDCHTQQLEDEIARLRAMVESAEANAKLHFEAAEEMRAAMSAKTRDARAERIGRAVLLSFGYAPFTYYKWADALERHTLVTPARLLRAIADAMGESDA